MNIIFFHPRYDNFRGFFSSIFVKRPVNLDYMIFPLILDVIFKIYAEENIVPLNLKRKDFISHAILQIVKELILIKYNCTVLIKLLLLIFYEYLSKFVLVSLVRICDAVGNSRIYLQVWALPIGYSPEQWTVMMIISEYFRYLKKKKSSQYKEQKSSFNINATYCFFYSSYVKLNSLVEEFSLNWKV